MDMAASMVAFFVMTATHHGYFTTFAKRTIMDKCYTSKEECLQDDEFISTVVLIVDNGFSSVKAIRLKLYECGYHVSYMPLLGTVETLCKRHVVEMHGDIIIPKSFDEF